PPRLSGRAKLDGFFVTTGWVWSSAEKIGKAHPTQASPISTRRERVPVSRADFRRFPFAQRFSCRYFGTGPNPFNPAICRQSTIALRWFSEISELSTVFR